MFVSTAPGIEPPVRSSHVAPTVAKKVRPAWLSQKRRGRATPRVYFGRSAHPSSLTSVRCCPLALASSVTPHCFDKGAEYHRPTSVAPRDDRLRSSWRSGFVPGRRETRFTTPLIAPAPYSDEATPLMTSARPRSSGGICIRPSDTCSPKSGSPSDRNRVYRPRMPWMRTLAAPIDGDVACTRMPPISFSIMTMSPGVIITFSSISSASSTSTRIG